MREHNLNKVVCELWAFNQRTDVELCSAIVLYDKQLCKSWSWKVLVVLKMIVTVLLLKAGRGRWKWQSPRASPNSWHTSPGGSQWTSASVTWPIPSPKAGRKVSTDQLLQGIFVSQPELLMLRIVLKRFKVKGYKLSVYDSFFGGSSRVTTDIRSVQTSSGTHTASCSMGTVGKAAGTWSWQLIPSSSAWMAPFLHFLIFLQGS